jgi:hypothetical protein
MIITLALRSLAARPVRSAVLAAGFGFGVAVMAALLGIGGVILEQSRAPALVGGGDVVIGGGAGRIPSAKFVLSGVLGTGTLADRVAATSPSIRTTLYLVDGQGATPIRVRGGVPSLERALGDQETSAVAAWTDTPADAAWISPPPGTVLREMDRFHAIPDVPARAQSWAEWLYFNGRTTDARFYLTFLAGPRRATGLRPVGVRLQLERQGRMTSYSQSVEVDDRALVESAPDLTVGGNRVRLEGSEYRITLDLPGEAGSHVSGSLVIRAVPGRSVPPFTLRGAGGWVSGYVVPVMTGELAGTLDIGAPASAGRDRIDLTGGTGYHDHNWGFWEGVSWQWGQVQDNGLSFVFGRVRPPSDAADPRRIPGFFAAIGPDGPIGFATDVTIEETNRAGTDRPERIVVSGRGDALSLTLDLAVDQSMSTPMREGMFGAGMDFLQMRGRYRVSGTMKAVPVNFTAAGSAETFRGKPHP